MVKPGLQGPAGAGSVKSGLQGPAGAGVVDLIAVIYRQAFYRLHTSSLPAYLAGFPQPLISIMDLSRPQLGTNQPNN